MELENESIQILSNGVFKTTQILCKFYEEEMTPQFKVVIKPTPKDNAMFDAYQKMYLYLASLSKLDNKMYYQTVLNVVRSMFELFLDITCLNRDNDDIDTQKYFDYPQIARYKMSKKILEYLDKHPTVDIGGYFSIDFISGMRACVNEMEGCGKAKKLKEKHWPDRNNYPLYWSGMSCENFAADLEQTPKFLRIYPLYSWVVHSGPTGFKTLDVDTMECLFYYGHQDAHNLFLESTEIIAEHFHFSKSINNFKDYLMNLKELPKRFFFEESLENLKNKK